MQGKNMGLLPPQAPEAEQWLLCSLLTEPSAFHRISSWIFAESFYREDHKVIFRAISQLHASSKHVDFLSVTQQLRSTSDLEAAGGAGYVTELTSKAASSATVERDALYIQQKFLQREMIRTCSDYIGAAYSDAEDIFDLYDNLSSDLFQKVAVNVGKEPVEFNDILKERLKSYEEEAPDGLTGLTSGFVDIDKITGGWQDTDLIIVAARPGMGKTAFILNVARHGAVKGKKPIAIFSLEMSKEQLVDRIVSAETEIYFEKIRKKRLTEFDNAQFLHMNSLIDSQIFIDDTGGLTLQALRSKAIRLKHKHNIGMIVIDYLQLMHGEKGARSGNREQDISAISRGCKSLAKELGIPVIALSQLSRAVESRPGANGKRPMLSDLRESGSLEQDADQVIFLFRPEYYGITEDEQGNSLIGLCETIFAKNRHGPLDTAILKFNGAFMKFSDICGDLPELPKDSPASAIDGFRKASMSVILNPDPYSGDEDDTPF
nr:replicative DNA helicase [Pedobacter sp. ASV19]